jgi:hypothetical protein
VFLLPVLFNFLLILEYSQPICIYKRILKCLDLQSGIFVYSKIIMLFSIVLYVSQPFSLWLLLLDHGLKGQGAVAQCNDASHEQAST